MPAGSVRKSAAGACAPPRSSVKTPAVPTGKSAAKQAPSVSAAKPTTDDLRATAKKTRVRDPLATSAYEALHQPETLTQCYLNGLQARAECDGRMVKMRFDRSRRAMQAARQQGVAVNADSGEIHEYCDGTITASLARRRRVAVSFVFEYLLGSPPAEQWDGRGGTVATIRGLLRIPVGSAPCVRKVLEDCVAMDEVGKEYDPARNLKEQCGRKPKIVDGTKEARLVFEVMEKGLGIGQAAALANVHRASLNHASGLGPDDDGYYKALSWSAVQAFIARSKCVDLHKRETKKSGKDDEGVSRARAHAARSQLFTNSFG